MNNMIENGKERMLTYVVRTIVALFGFSLIPVLVMGWYDYPSADDYGFGAYAHIAWHDTHNIFNVFGGAFQTVYERFFDWQGTFSTIFMMALQPAIWNENIYFLTVWIMVLALSLSTLFLLYVILVQIFNVDKKVWLGISFLTLLFDIQCMIDKTQGLYWFNGAAHYVLARGFALVLIAVMLQTLYLGKRRMVLASILGFFVGGCNLLTGLVMLIIGCLAMLVYLISKAYKRLKGMMVPYAFLAIGYLLNVIAPGNAVRAAGTAGTDTFGPIKSIVLSFYYCIDFFTNIWASWEWIGFILIVLPFAWIAAKTVCKNTEFRFQFPAVVIALGYCVLSAMFTPLLYAQGTTGTGRTYNIVFMDGVMWLLLDLFYISGWLIRHLGEKSFLEIKEETFKWYWITVFAFVMVLGLFYTKVDANRYTASSAIVSIVSGEAKAYANECQNQINVLKSYEGNQTDEVVVEKLHTHPYLTFYEDIDTDTNDWKNQLVERYYQIIKLRAEE